jgi:hypothetical protein
MEFHHRLVAKTKAAGKEEEPSPAWYVHLPSGERFRIKSINTYGPFVSFVAPDDETQALLGPEAVSITIEPVRPTNDTPRSEIGFQPPPN